MQRLAGILFVIGAIAFIVGAIAFIGQTGFFDVEGEVAQIEAIETHRSPWNIGWIILPTGGVIAALGMLAQAKHFNETDDRKWVKRWSNGVARV